MQYVKASILLDDLIYEKLQINFKYIYFINWFVDEIVNVCISWCASIICSQIFKLLINIKSIKATINKKIRIVIKLNSATNEIKILKIHMHNRIVNHRFSDSSANWLMLILYFYLSVESNYFFHFKLLVGCIELFIYKSCSLNSIDRILYRFSIYIASSII